MSLMSELDLVELVSPDGVAIGSSTVADAHTADGLLHRAFSVLLFDGPERTLLQRRAKSKTRFPLKWANACCGHPVPGEPVIDAATRRLFEELGVREVDLVEVGVYPYHAEDRSTGRVEREYDHVLVGRVPADVVMAPDGAEVAATRWVAVSELRAALDGSEGDTDHAPWLRGVLRVALDAGVISGLSEQ